MKFVAPPLLMLIFLTLPAVAFAAPGLLWQVPEGGPAQGSGAAQLNIPRGVTTDPTNGHVYVAELGNARVSEFTAWGQFVRAFGWGVNADGPEAKSQACTTTTGCQAGSKGGGTGQFEDALGVAVGSGGNVYVADLSNRRVQAFDSAGNFVLMFGGKVNKTKVEAAAPAGQQNRCPVDPGDVCQAGTSGTGNGEFSNVSVGDYIDAGPGGSIYVGDKDRIQVFDAEGVYQSQFGLPKEGEAVGAPSEGKGQAGSLAFDGAGNLYFTFASGFQSGVPKFPNIYKRTVAGWSLFAETGMSLEALAVDGVGNVYAAADPSDGFLAIENEPRVLQFDAAGNKLIPTEAEEEAELKEPPVAPFPFGQVVLGTATPTGINGLATSSACGIAGQDLLVTYAIPSQSLLRAYGPNPDPTICLPPEDPPSIADQFATSVDEDAATVKARINSHFWPTTTYLVAYGGGKCSEGGCTEEQPAAPLPLNSESGLAVSTAGVFLPGLSPNTTYHYRFVARTRFEGSSGDEVEVKGVGGKVGLDGAEGTFTTPDAALPAKTSCAHQQFRGDAAARLSDCRAYELVSPVDKAGGDIVALLDPLNIRTGLSQSALTGDRLTYSSYRAFGAAKGAPYTSQYLSSRGSGGWSTEPLSPGRGRPLVGNPLFTLENEYKAFSENLCRSYLRLEFDAESVFDPAEVEGFPNLYQRQGCGAQESYGALTTVAPPNLTPSQYYPELQGSSEDGSCAVFRAADSLTPEAPFLGNESATVLYEICDGVLRLLAVLPNGSLATTRSTAGSGNFPESNTEFQNKSALVQGAVSADASKVYWTASGNGPGKLYLRLNADEEPTASGVCEESEPQGACTIAVSPGSSARFWFGAEDGSRAVFTEGEKLFEFVLAENGEPSGEVTPIADGVQGLLGASEDATRIYFASTKQIGGKGSAGQPNLYYREAGGEAAFIGTLAAIDVGPSLLRSIAIDPASFKRAARVTPDGLHATFMSAAPLTGFDNTDQNSGEADAEVFAYDANQEELICPSCDPSRAAPLGRNIGNEVSQLWAAATIPTWDSQFYGSRVISDDGSRLFFNSFGPLVQRDTNGKADVYEWQRADSQKACEEAGAERYVPSAAGCLSLISSGESNLDSEFIDASASGRDVFFATGASLLAQDPGLIDIYDARSGGGFPPPPAPAPECEGQACQSPAAAPNDPTPASLGFREAQSAPASKPRCAKGKTRRKGRCVARKPGAQRHRSKRSQRSTNGNRGNHR